MWEDEAPSQKELMQHCNGTGVLDVGDLTDDNIASRHKAAEVQDVEMVPELRKLGVTAGQHILLQHAPKAFLEAMRVDLPPRASLTTRTGTGRSFDVIFHWLAPDENLDGLFDQVQHRLAPNGSLWVVIPNQRAARVRGVHYDWNAIVAAALKTTLVDNKTLSFSSEEYGTRFVIRRIFRDNNS